MSVIADISYRDWVRSQLKRPGFDYAGLAQAWNLDRTAISKVLTGVRRLLVTNIVSAARYFGEDPHHVAIDPSMDLSAIDRNLTVWLARCCRRKGDMAALAAKWEADRSTVSKAASGGRPLTMGELEIAALHFATNPPGFEFKDVPAGGHRLSHILETGVYREEVATQDKPFVIERDDAYPLADLRIYPVAGRGMDALEPRPILTGDLVVGVLIDQLESADDIGDGSLVVVRREIEEGTCEWSLRMLSRTMDGLSLAARSATNFAPLRAKGFDDPKVQVVALARRVVFRV